jgi:hypothetical protein
MKVRRNSENPPPWTSLVCGRRIDRARKTGSGVPLPDGGRGRHYRPNARRRREHGELRRLSSRFLPPRQIVSPAHPRKATCFTRIYCRGSRCSVYSGWGSHGATCASSTSAISYRKPGCPTPQRCPRGVQKPTLRERNYIVCFSGLEMFRQEWRSPYVLVR